MKNSKKWIVIFLSVIAIGVIVCFSCYYAMVSLTLSRHYFDDIEIVSPNGDYTLQICEWEALGGTGAEIYYVDNDGRVKLGQTTAKSGVYPFRNGLYVIEWTDEYIRIKYRTGTGVETVDTSSWQVTTFSFPNTLD